MKKIGFQKNIAKLEVENNDDLWYLSQIIESGDYVSGRTLRKLKSESTERAMAAKRKPVFMKIETERVEFGDGLLRILGKVVEGPDDVAIGSHHSFVLEFGTRFEIEKKNWLKYQLKRLDEAANPVKSKVLICVMDREEAYFALMKRNGYELLSNIKGDVQKKRVDEKKKQEFYPSIVKQLLEYDERYNLDHIIIGSPSFFKEDLIKQIPDELKKKVISCTCSAVGKNGIDEVLKRDEARSALQKGMISQEMVLVEKLLTEISKDGKGVYGEAETINAVESGAVELLLVTDKKIIDERELDGFEKIEKIMKQVEEGAGEVHIISSDHDGGTKLNGLGGIGGVLRYKV